MSSDVPVSQPDGTDGTSGAVPAMTEVTCSEAQLLSKVVDCVSKYHFLCDRPNVKFFSEGLWKRVPEEWLAYLANLSNDELNSFPFQKPSHDCPETLLEFHEATVEIARLLDLCLAELPSYDVSQCATSLVEVNGSVSAKKRHEVENFAALLTSYCKLHDINRIVDIGCGVVTKIFPNVCLMLCIVTAYAEIVCLNVACDGSEDQRLLEFLLGDEVL
ncbi:unnamed protein product [Gongylonema pulchrum]|uniref:Methyltransferase n=1 Tax=Gongylonema pulchrum TaxID=637853 RepID=A0A183DQT4_9BILA|nr:unnamed protein product [Gongylonema pulchrum]